MERDGVKLIEANIDDMNPQVYEYLLERLMDEGALDAHLQNIIMKKGRPAIKVSVICVVKDVEKMAGILMEETTTIGVRVLDAQRLKLPRKIVKVNTKYGIVPVKISEYGGIRTVTPEYDDCARIAKAKKVPLREVICEANDAAKMLK